MLSKPLNKIVIIAISSVILAQLSYMIMEKGLEHYNFDLREKLDEILVNKTNYDVLFLGSSRMQTSVDPKIIDSICHVNSYNAGTEGGKLFETNMIFKAYLQDHPLPKRIVLSVEFGSFNLSQLFFNYVNYYSYLDNKIIDETLNENGYSTTAIKILPFLAICEYDDYMRTNAFKGLSGQTDKTEGEFRYKGYFSNGKDSISFLSEQREKVFIQMDAKAIKAFDEIISTCKQNNIELIITYPPEYKFEAAKRTFNSSQFFDLMYSKIKQNKLEYWRHDSLPMGSQARYFTNPGHLNTLGAQEYSKILAELLNKDRTTTP